MAINNGCSKIPKYSLSLTLSLRVKENDVKVTYAGKLVKQLKHVQITLKSGEDLEYF